MDFPPSSFWSFSLAIYRKPGVAEACLGLQDRHGLDVNLLLAALFAGTAGTALDEAGWALLDVTVGAYHREVVRPLRAARRALKPFEEGPRDGGPFEGGLAVAAQLRSAVKAAELDAEHLEQLMIEEVVIGLQAGQPKAPTGAGLAHANVLAYLAAARVAPDAADQAAIARLVAAIPSSS